MRSQTVSAMVAIFAAALAWALVTPSAAPAADLLQPTYTMFLTERFESSGRKSGTAKYGTRSLLAFKGEREGFQVVMQNGAGKNLRLAARIDANAALASAMKSGKVTFELLRVGFVNVPKASTGMKSRPGMYADPLPPLRTDSSAGLLSIPAGQYGGFAVIAKVRTDASAGSFAGDVELYAGSTVYARQPFTLDVLNKKLLQQGDNKSFSTVLNVEGEAYWLQSRDMRDRPKGSTAWANRMAQLQGLMGFLDARGVTPLEMPFANPSNTGRYNCYLDMKGIGRKTFLAQLKDYFRGVRDVDPTKGRFPVRFAPTKTAGCNPDKLTAKFESTIPAGTGAKQDDRFNPKAPAFFSKVKGAFSSNGLWGQRTYVKHPFDEPSAANAAYRKTMDVEVPKATVALRKAFGAKAKIVLADWPRDAKNTRVCRKFNGGQRCTTLSGDEHTNRKQWDGKGVDDPHVWMVPFSRLWGRTTPPVLKRDYKVNRDREYADRLAKLKKLRGTREVWAYNFYTADKRVPQLSIDAPGTDSRLQYWMLAREGHSGLFVSNLMMGWGGANQNHPGTSLRRKGNPYEGALYFKHGVYGVAAGWGTFIYPGYYPALGLTGETARNSTNAMPVTSLRLEGMRDGAEDANLHAMYRKVRGENAYKRLMRKVFPGSYVPLAGSKLGNVVTLRYTNSNSLSARMESVRKQMMFELAS